MFSNPFKDVDLAVTTDFEDLLAFLGDNIEFAEQDKSLMLDALLDFFATPAVEFSTLAAVELFVLRQMLRVVNSAALAKVFSI